MRTVSLELPNGLHERLQQLAKKNKVSINLLVATALADKILMTHAGKSSTARNHNH